jgi:hypothetical protein
VTPGNAAPEIRGRRGVSVVDGGPYEMAELADLFRGLELDKLAGAWVACVVDSVMEHRPPVGATARALIVVAERLHNVQFERRLMAEQTPSVARETAITTGFMVVDGAPPPAKRGQRNDPIGQAILGLKTGQHLRVSPKAIKKATLASKIAALRKTGRKDLRSYVADNGDLIVVRDWKVQA